MLCIGLGQQLSRINWNNLHLSAPELALMTGAGLAEVLILAAACLHAVRKEYL